MNDVSLPTVRANTPSTELGRALKSCVKGDVRFDKLSRALFATDASIYEIVPTGVVFPKDAQDVANTIKTCAEFQTSVVPRGAGTGLAGGAVGSGVQVDLSRYMNKIGSVDVDKRTVVVEPGVVLDELNRFLSPHRLFFAPDVATSSRATIGGMIANNSCGARSVRYGRTVDHVLELTVVLADGQIVSFQRDGHAGEVIRTRAQRVHEIEQGLGRIRDDYHEEIQARFPKVMRSNGGYGLDRLGPRGTLVDVTRILCGSEGTLGIVVSAMLNLEPLPNHTALVVLHYDDLLKSLAAVPAILKHHPAAVELIDRMIIDAGRANSAIRDRCRFLSGDPEGILAVEFFADDPAALDRQMRALLSDREVVDSAFAAVPVSDPQTQADVWNLRKAGLGLMMSKPGDDQPYSFVEDTAVDPARLGDYIERFEEILKREVVVAGYYAHASVGCLHVKPVLNLKRGADVERMSRIAQAVCDLAVEFGGTMTGEHGDGLVRSCWLERMYGPQIMQAFREVKNLFDPSGKLNPNKIVDAPPMTDHLRYGPIFRSFEPKTAFDFSSHGGMAGLAGMCSGVGQCRQKEVGTMCPSYMATHDEMHTTRARANALRLAMSNRGLIDGLGDSALAEVMDLCISCKACKTECPTGVDMARLKSEWLSHRNLLYGASDRARFLAEVPHRLNRMKRFRSIYGTISRSGLFRRVLAKRYGLDHRIVPPRLSKQTFRAWFRKHVRAKTWPTPPRGRVIYFVDTWMNHFTPEVGRAAVFVLEHAGYQVLCPPTECCGRVAISQGLLAEAKQLALENVNSLATLVASGVPVVGTEPSCVLTLVDEYPQLVRGPMAATLARRTMMIETFLADVLRQNPESLRFNPSTSRALFHAHCHQKSLVGTADLQRLLTQTYDGKACEIPSGCCGMAGAFGHEAEHYDIAQSIGEDRLFPAVRSRGTAEILVSGFSCRQQIEHHTDARVSHYIERIANALGHDASVL